jgi:hypothetical protein
VREHERRLLDARDAANDQAERARASWRLRAHRLCGPRTRSVTCAGAGLKARTLWSALTGR